MLAAICQPEHLPWLGWFDKARQADALVLLDTVQFKKRYFENRNRIRTAQGWVYLTVPVITKGRYRQRISEVEIDPTADWAGGHWKAMRLSYAKAPFFKDYAGFFEELYLKSSWSKLSDLNIRIIEWGLRQFGLTPRLYKSSELGVEDGSSALLAKLCEKIGAGTYLSGISGREYLDESEFSRRGVSVQYQEFLHPVYDQVHGGFEPCMAFVDLLFNHGPKSRDLLSSCERRLSQAFT